MCLKIEPPGWFRVGPAVHRRRDQIRAVLNVAEDYAALPCGVPSGGGQLEHSPLVGRWRSKDQPAAADRIQSAMELPEDADDPPRRQEGGRGFSRHDTLLT